LLLQSVPAILIDGYFSVKENAYEH